MPRFRRTVVAIVVLTVAALLVPGGTATGSAEGRPWWEPVSRPAPDSGINVSGAPFKGTGPDGRVRGWVDAHNHVMTNEAFGGRLICGRPFSWDGVEDALKDCPEHYPNGSGALFENLTGGSPGTHDPVGWPTFKDWPSSKSFTHQQNYYAWVERAWRAGQRVMVTDLTSNGMLCALPIIAKDGRSCDEMESVRLQARKTYEMQDFVDAMYGGAGKGWFRIVTSPQQAIEVIKQGKLAVVLGVETSEPFGCKQVLDVAQCSKADIDRGLDELQSLGVSSMFICHKYDNALCGVRFDPGVQGVIVNVGQLLSTGTTWSTEACPTERTDNPIFSGPSLIESTLGVDLPGYDPAKQCNPRGLTRLGEYAVEKMIKRHMMIELDHMSVKAADRTFEIAEAHGYPGLISSHSWMDSGWTERLYQLGGFATTYGHEPAHFVEEQARTAGLRDKYGKGSGLGIDMNGVANQSPPQGADSPIKVTYPYRSLDGGSMLDRQVTGSRTWDVNTDGAAHYGLVPDYLEQVRLAGGDMNDLMNGAASYLDTWSAAIAHQDSPNLALGRTTTASSSEWNPLTSYGAANATDGNTGTRWASGWSDDEWVQVDLSTARTVGSVTVDWERAHAAAYSVETSTDGRSWRTVWSTQSSNGGLDTARFTPVTARYVRVHGARRATTWGYSLWELAVRAS